MTWLHSADLQSGSGGHGPLTANSRPTNPFDATQLTWTPLVASTSAAWNGFFIQWEGTSAKGLISVATGSAGNEVIIATLPTIRAYRQQVGSTYIPIAIPAGTRVSVSFATKQTNTSCLATIIGYPATVLTAPALGTVMECGPFDLTNTSALYSNGVQVDPGGTLNTKGAWTEISMTSHTANVLQGNSLPRQYKYLGIIVADTVNTTQTAHWSRIDVGYGSVGNETLVVSNWAVYMTLDEHLIAPDILWIPWNRPAGDRIVVRMQADTIDATDRLLEFFLVGIR